ncbi:MAG: sugar phosphate isomerase/epimerase family protein [Eubacteriales bacterium]
MFKYSVILGNVGSCSDRYMTCGYGRTFELEELFERVASIEGVTGIEYIGNWHVTDKTLGRLVDLKKQYKFESVAIIPDHFGSPIWAKGAFTAPDAAVRHAAIDETLHTAEHARALDCPIISIWNGQDGYDYPMQADYINAQKWLSDGLAECCEKAPDIKFSLEYKPKEPRTHCFIPNVWAALTLINESKMPNMGVTIDVGHSLEAYEDVAEAVCAAMARGRMFHFHMNDNWRLWDDDMIAGSVHTIEYIEMFYWLRKLDYKGFISTDQYPYREDTRDAVEQTVKWMRTFERVAMSLDMNRVQGILDKNDAVGASEYLRELMFRGI